MNTPVHVTIWDETSTGTPSVVFVHGTMTWGTDEYFSFAAQRPLGKYARLIIMDRRGFGESPDLEHSAYTSDYDIDSQDVVALLGDGAHLVGHSYGGVVAMLAAARSPQTVRSLTLIEPSAYRAAEQDPTVAAALQRNRELIRNVPSNITAEEWLRLSTESVDIPIPEPTPMRLRASWTAMHERPSWDAEIPIEALTVASYPKLVISGTWENAPQRYRVAAGKPLMACARVVAERINGELLRVSGASHYPHWEQSETVNMTLRNFWKQ